MRRGYRSALLFSLAAWAAVYFWLGGTQDPFWRGYAFRGRQHDYYNLLVEGFAKGELSMNAGVDRGLLSADPAVRARAPYLLDAALFRGKYYLYYGVVPAVLLLYPYLSITGNELGLEVVCLFFGLGGLAIGALWLWRLREWLRAEWGPGFAMVAMSVIAIVPGATFLVRRSTFYDVAVLSGSFFIIAFWFALFMAWSGSRPRSWIALASISFALAVGCRPTHFLTGPLLLVFAAILARRDRLSFVRLLVPAVLPALPIGILLAGYNAARFGNPFDFGTAHDIDGFFTSGHPLFALRFLPANLRWYFLTPPSLKPWFPFDFPIQNRHVPVGFTDTEDISGFLPITLLAAWAALCVLAARRRRPPAPDLSAFGWDGLPWMAAAVELAFAGFLGVRAYRYATDFMTPLAIGLILLLARAWGGESVPVRRAGIAVLTLVASLHSLLGSVQLFDLFRDRRPREFTGWSACLNPRQLTLQALGAEHRGAVAMTVRFQKPPAPVTLPLVTTGRPGACDRVMVTVHPNGFVAFDLLHSGYGGPRSELLPVEWNRPYHLKVLMGSLFPEAADPVMAAWNPVSVDAAKTLGRIEWEGRAIVNRRMAFYPGSPRFHSAGDAGIGEFPSGSRRFAQVDSYVAGLPVAAESLADDSPPPAFFKLLIRLPAAAKATAMPLLSSGITGHGDLLFLDPQPDGKFRLGVDQWGYGTVEGPEFDPPDGAPALFEILVGPALDGDSAPLPWAGADLGTLKGRLLVWHNGALVGNFEVTHYLDSFGALLVGKNEAGFTSAASEFAGELQRLPVGKDDAIGLERRALALGAPGPDR